MVSLPWKRAPRHREEGTDELRAARESLEDVSVTSNPTFQRITFGTDAGGAPAGEAAASVSTGIAGPRSTTSENPAYTNLRASAVTTTSPRVSMPSLEEERPEGGSGAFRTSTEMELKAKDVAADATVANWHTPDLASGRSQASFATTIRSETEGRTCFGVGSKPFELPGFLAWARLVVLSKPQIVLWITLHLLITGVIFQHFFYHKLMQKMDAVPEAAPNRWQKILVPAFEFGIMHTNLWIMVFLPLTMCHACSTALRRTPFAPYLPLDFSLSLHILLGLWFVVAVIITTVGFFAHFATLCRNESPKFCDKFSEEIFITGLVIFASCMIIGFTSPNFVRKKIPYEVFYYVHHFFVAVYLVGIIHTIDVKGRKSFFSRSQNILWYGGPLALYIMDRAMRFMRVKRVRATRAMLYTSPQAIVLNVERPQKFSFLAGQYVRIAVPSLGRKSLFSFEWHPYSIASAPGSRAEPARRDQIGADANELQFFIKVHEGGWTDRLAKSLRAAEGRSMEVLIDGPYGSPIQGAFRQSRMLMAATGPGIVPMLSLLRDLRCRGKIALPDQHASPKSNITGAQVITPTPSYRMQLPLTPVRPHQTRQAPKELALASARYAGESEFTSQHDPWGDVPSPFSDPPPNTDGEEPGPTIGFPVSHDEGGLVPVAAQAASSLPHAMSAEDLAARAEEQCLRPHPRGSGPVAEASVEGLTHDEDAADLLPADARTHGRPPTDGRLLLPSGTSGRACHELRDEAGGQLPPWEEGSRRLPLQEEAGAQPHRPEVAADMASAPVSQQVSQHATRETGDLELGELTFSDGAGNSGRASRTHSSGMSGFGPGACVAEGQDPEMGHVVISEQALKDSASPDVSRRGDLLRFSHPGMESPSKGPVETMRKYEARFAVLTSSEPALWAAYARLLRRDAAVAEAHAVPGIHLVWLFAASLQIALLALDFSFLSSGMPHSPWRRIADGLSAGLIASSVAHAALSAARERRLRLAALNTRRVGTGAGGAALAAVSRPAPYVALLHATVAAAAAVLLACTFGAVRSTGATVTLALLRVYMAVWQLVANPLFAAGAATVDGDGETVDTAFVRRVELVWSVASAEHYLWLHAEIAQIAAELRASHGTDAFDISVHITRCSCKDETRVIKMVAGTELEGCIHLRRVNWARALARAVNRAKPGRTSGGKETSTLGIVFSGSSEAGRALASAVAIQSVSQRDMQLVYRGENILR